MAERAAVDEATLLWAAALVEGVDPAALLERLEGAALATLAGVAADVEETTEPLEAAARLLVRMVRDRPFPADNAAIGWLAAVELLAAAHWRVEVDPRSVADLCGRVRDGAIENAEVASVLGRWAVADGVACPACGRRVYVLDAAARRVLLPGVADFELRARCAFEHGHHDRSGRPIAAREERPAEAPQPVLAWGECGSFLVAGDGASLVISPCGDDPPTVRVVEVDDVRPADLVGRWDRLVARSSTLGVIAAGAAQPDERGTVDLASVRRALRRSHPAGSPSLGEEEAGGRLAGVAR
ncbi:MAG TPA: hypothetical protein VHN98_00785 [Acidimicrobiales bacterium]|nr:hypothetical protein [Acidimicrobiales bacterium]